MTYRVEGSRFTYHMIDDHSSLAKALVIGQVRDLWMTQTLIPFTVETDNALIYARRAENGFFCLSGDRERVFPRQDVTYTLTLTLNAPGYKPLQRMVNIYPLQTFPLYLGVLSLTPIPSRLQGVVRNQTSGVPITGAHIRFTPDPAVAVPTEYPIALRMPLHHTHVGGAIVCECDLTPVGTPRRILYEASGGSTVLALEDITALASGDLLRVDTTGALLVIAALGARMYEVTLRDPLIATLPAFSTVTEVSPSIPGGAITRLLTQVATAGEGLLLCDGDLDVEAIQIDSAGLVEYRAVGALTNAMGAYRVDGVGRTRELFVDASAVGFQALASPARLVLAPSAEINTLDFKLKP